MRIAKRFWVGVLCLAVILILSEQGVSQNNPKWINYISPTGKFTNLKEDSRNPVLLGNNIDAIAIDSTGHLWFGTWGGLISYNGSEWQVYTKSNSGLPSNGIVSIAIDRENNKWIGTKRKGLAKFDGENWTIYNSQNSGLPHFLVNSIAIDRNGDKWIGTGYGGIVVFDDINWSVLDTSNTELPGNNISCITIDKQGNKWIGTNAGLAKFDGKHWEVFKKSYDGLPHNAVRVIKIDRDDNKWIGTFGNGLAKFDGKNWVSYSKLPSKFIWDIAIDNYDHKWIGMRDGGFAEFDNYDWKFFTPQNSQLPSDRVKSIFVDNHDNKWLGTWNGGLVLYQDSHLYSEKLETEISEPVHFDPVVYETQQRLKELGYQIEKIDGRFHKETELAIASFQKISGLRRSATLNTATLTKLGLANITQLTQTENWQTLYSPTIKLSISFPTYSKVIHLRPGPAQWSGQFYGRVENFSTSEDLYELQENEYFLEFMAHRSEIFDLDKFSTNWCIDSPQKYSRFDHAYTCTPKLEAEVSITHVLFIWKNGVKYYIDIDASKLAPGIVEKIFASIELK